MYAVVIATVSMKFLKPKYEYMRTTIRTIISTTVLFFVTQTVALVSSKEDTNEPLIDPPELERFDWDKEYEKVVEFIKHHEGFNSGDSYYDMGGTLTVGHGHVILPGETFTLPMTLEQGDSLLRSDLNKAIAAIERNTHLEDNQKLAMAHFVFARGIGTFNRSEMKKKIMQGKPIDNEIVKWSYYRTRSGRKIQSKRALNIRLWELSLYKKRFY